MKIAKSFETFVASILRLITPVTTFENKNTSKPIHFDVYIDGYL